MNDLARRIASYPPNVVAAAKQAVDAAAGEPTPGLLLEDELFRQTLAAPGAARMQAFLNNGGQTLEVERGELSF